MPKRMQPQQKGKGLGPTSAILAAKGKDLAGSGELKCAGGAVALGGKTQKMTGHGAVVQIKEPGQKPAGLTRRDMKYLGKALAQKPSGTGGTLRS